LSIVSDGYVEDLSDKDGKGLRNVEFVRLMAHYLRSGREIVYLDAPSALTTNTLHTFRHCFGFKKLHVPNLDADFLKHAPDDFSSKATYYHASFYEWGRDLSEDDDATYDVGLDYCCTFGGDAKAGKIPKADLTLMFQKRLLAQHNGILWLTFSTRSAGNSIAKTKRDVVEWIQTTARHFQYGIKLETMGNYGGGMVYFFFRTFQN
jgi:hypothetical protein